MFAKKLLPVVAALSVLSFSSIVTAQEKGSYSVSVFHNYNKLPANSKASDKTRNKVAAQFRGWVAVTDKISGSFTDIHGAPIELTGNTNMEKAANCMATSLKGFDVRKDEWKTVSTPSARNADYVNYTQSISGHKVVFSKLSFRFTRDGTLARILMKNYGSPAATAPAISKDDALRAAMKGLDDVTISSSVVNDWSWFPVPAAQGYKLHPAWQFYITGDEPGSIPLSLTGYVDAITGELLYRTNKTREIGYDVTVKGVVYKDGTTLPATNEPLPDIKLGIGTATVYADGAGIYTDVSLLAPVTTNFPLAGKWSFVVDYATSVTPTFSSLVSPAPTVYTYPTTAPASSRHINAYYHTTRVHNFMKYFFPTFTDLDAPLRTVVDRTTGTCNAYANDTSINFYSASAGCNSFAEIGDIVYHEYGHMINGRFYEFVSGMQMENGSLNEGYADIWALSITHDPVLAKNSFIPYGGFIRRYDMTPQVYPIDMDETVAWPDPHKIGQIIAGCWWDLGVNLGSVDTMARLFTDCFYDAADAPDGMEGDLFHEILIDVLMADDDDANLSNGTPHYPQIIAAFARHGVCVEGDILFNHTELNNQKADVTIPVSATMVVTDASLYKDLVLYYRVNSAGVWNSIALTASGTSYSGNLPGQPAGTTVEYYFTVRDRFDNPNAFFPTTCNSSMPAHQVTIPYQFGVGIKGVDSNNFETTLSGYGVGGNAGDNATSGTWKQALPAATIAGDHTTGSGMCLNSGNPTLSAGMSGTSTVVTPVFDISGFANPVIEFYRWYSNGLGNNNFKNDPWIVRMRDAGGSTWQTIESTYQGDPSWRRRIFPVSAYLPGTTTQVQLKFFSSDSVVSTWRSNGQSKVIAAIDDIYIYDKKTAADGVAEHMRPEYKVYPVPADGTLRVEMPFGFSGRISLWDLNGRKIQEVTMTEKEHACSIDTKNLADGVYNLMIGAGSSIQVKKVVVAHHQ